MYLTRLFLLLMIITIGLVIAQISGYQFLELIIIMIIIDFLSLGAIIELQKRSSKDIEVMPKLENIEKACNDILHKLGSNPGFEEKLQKQKDDMSYILDKIAKRSLELEEKINTFGRALVDSRETIKMNSNPKEEAKTENVENEKAEETSSIGETIYVDEEE